MALHAEWHHRGLQEGDEHGFKDDREGFYWVQEKGKTLPIHSC